MLCVCFFLPPLLSGSEPPSSPQLVDEGVDEDDEELSGGEEVELRVSSGRGSVLTRRGITLRVLLKDGLVEPGDAVLSIHYLVRVPGYTWTSPRILVRFYSNITEKLHFKTHGLSSLRLNGSSYQQYE